MGQFSLETPRLRLRELEATDIDFVADMLGDPEVMRFYPRQYSRSESLDWIERQRARYARDGHGLWLVTERDGEHAVGQVGLVSHALPGWPGSEYHEVGYLLHRQFWGRGFATEAATVVREFAFTAHDQGEVISLIRPENDPSQAVARRLGMSVRGETSYVGMRHLVFGISRGAVEATSVAESFSNE